MSKTKIVSRRDAYIDILKGIGIISVVIGHCGIIFPGQRHPYEFQQFLYQYHLMIFFFTTGMLYRPEKGRDVYGYIGRKIKGCVPLYIGYNVAYVLLNNLFIRGHLIDGAYYSINEMLVHISSSVVLMHTELLTGPLWFVPMYLFAVCLFNVVFQWAERSRYTASSHIMACILVGSLALYLNNENLFLLYNIQTALLAIPVIYMGYVFKKCADKLEHMINPVTGALSAFALVWCVKNVGFIQLSENMIISPVLFYPVTMVGMVFCLSLGKIIKYIPYLGQATAACGRESFHLMALHFTAFKVFDWIYGVITDAGWEAITKFPMALDERGWLYAIFGITLSMLVISVYRQVVSARS